MTPQKNPIKNTMKPWKNIENNRVLFLTPAHFGDLVAV